MGSVTQLRRVEEHLQDYLPPSSREAVAKFRVSPPGQLPVLWVPWERRLGQVRREYRK